MKVIPIIYQDEETKLEDSHTSLSAIRDKFPSAEHSSHVVDNLDELFEELHKRTVNELKQSYSITTNAIKDHKNTTLLFEYIEAGQAQDLDRIEGLLSSSPLLHLREASDPDSLINRRNVKGIRPLYAAVKQGHLHISRLLFDCGADPHMLSQVGNEQESCLTVAARWRYVQIVKWLLQVTTWSNLELRLAYKATSHKEIQELLMTSMQNFSVFWRCLCLR